MIDALYPLGAAEPRAAAPFANPLSIAGAAILLVSIVVFILIGRAYVRAENEEKKAEVVKTMLEGIGGFAVLVGLVFTWQELTNSRIATEQGQRADRFTAAMQGLVGDSAESKAAGVIVLGEVANADPEVYARPVQESLTAFVRRNLSAYEPRSQATPAATPGLIATPGLTASPVSLAMPKPVPYEARLALDVLLDQARSDGNCLDLSRIDLRGVGSVFRGRTIKNVCFNRSLLAGVSFSGSQLENVTFDSADLPRARFVDATLKCVSLVDADMPSADFRNTAMTYVGFDLADLSDAKNLTEEQLRDSDYLGAVPPTGTWELQPRTSPDQWDCPEEPVPITT